MYGWGVVSTAGVFDSKGFVYGWQLYEGGKVIMWQGSGRDIQRLSFLGTVLQGKGKVGTIRSLGSGMWAQQKPRRSTREVGRARDILLSAQCWTVKRLVAAAGGLGGGLWARQEARRHSTHAIEDKRQVEATKNG